MRRCRTAEGLWPVAERAGPRRLAQDCRSPDSFRIDARDHASFALRMGLNNRWRLIWRILLYSSDRVFDFDDADGPCILVV